MGRPKKVLNIHTEDIKRAAPTFDRESHQLRAAAMVLQTKLLALGEPWGGDEQGQKFAEPYKRNQDNIERAVGILATGLESIHVALRDMADGHVDNEEAIVGMFTPVPEDGGGASGPPGMPHQNGGPGPDAH